jgi:ectoine hydroxylase-related dioxygenase (phytanoyl-CoA dioxygenase family)
MKKLTKNQIRFFSEKGYLHIRSVINKKKIANFKKTFFNLFNHFSGLDTSEDFDDPKLVKKFHKFRSKNKKKFFIFFRTLSLTNTFSELYNDKNILFLTSKLLKTSKNNLIIAEPQLRVDEPKDKFFTLDWHQDAAHYKQDPSGKNSLVINVSVQKLTENMGTPKLIPGSHKKKVFKTYNLKNIQKSKVAQLVPKKKDINIKDKVSEFVKSNPGDITIYDMRLLHKSGYNVSNKIRVSVISRAFNPIFKNFKSFRYITKILDK